MVIALAVSRERCAFHVDGLWKSTKGEGPKTLIVLWTPSMNKPLIFCQIFNGYFFVPWLCKTFSQKHSSCRNILKQVKYKIDTRFPSRNETLEDLMHNSISETAKYQ